MNEETGKKRKGEAKVNDNRKRKGQIRRVRRYGRRRREWERQRDVRRRGAEVAMNRERGERRYIIHV